MTIKHYTFCDESLFPMSHTSALQEAIEAAHKNNDRNAAQALIDKATKRQLIVVSACVSADCLLWLLHMILNDNHQELLKG